MGICRQSCETEWPSSQETIHDCHSDVDQRGCMLQRLGCSGITSIYEPLWTHRTGRRVGWAILPPKDSHCHMLRASKNQTLQQGKHVAGWRTFRVRILEGKVREIVANHTYSQPPTGPRVCIYSLLMTIHHIITECLLFTRHCDICVDYIVIVQLSSLVSHGLVVFIEQGLSFLSL